MNSASIGMLRQTQRCSLANQLEDALAGVEARKRGGFGCVVGIDRGRQSGALRQRGADIVIKTLR